ncbi:Gfo/Idh/MocA family protein [Streptomyces sp. NPDC051569]|uniref:Gfo/Idh/MocA family protein n=1 Tax=Streptomyces sp. NPDC051569 TaxID=3365661 RepID=UPI0037B7763D
MTPASPSRAPLGIGVLGCADIAWRRTVPALVGHPGTRLVASASRTEVKARRFADRFGGAAIAGYDALLAHPGVEAVYIPLPAMLQAEWVERALAAGKHVFAEKPLSARRADTERLLRAARERGLVLRENAMFLQHTQHATVARLVAEGAIGEVRRFEAAFTIPPKGDGDIRNRPDLGGGALLDMGFYPLRAALHFLGPDLTVAGATLRAVRDGVVRSGSVLLVTPAGVPAQLSFGMEHAYRSRYAIFGAAGSLSLDRAFTPPPSWQPVLQLDRQDHREEITLPPDDQFTRSVDAFIRSVHGDPAADDASAGAYSERVAALVEQVAATAVRTEI